MKKHFINPEAVIIPLGDVITASNDNTEGGPAPIGG
jgi:hypothetical protein